MQHSSNIETNKKSESNLNSRKSAFTLAEVFSKYSASSRKSAFTLSEVFSPHSVGCRKSAFTLAEVLITLGIIGVVAAMTLPILVSRYQEKVTVAKLKKTYSILSQAFTSAVAENGTPDNWGMGGMDDPNTHRIMANNFKPYIKLLKDCTNDTRSINCWLPTSASNIRSTFILADGTSVAFRNWNNNCASIWGNSEQLKNVCGNIIVDVNGLKTPNETARDKFSFMMTKYGLVPTGVKEMTRYPIPEYCNYSKRNEQNSDGFSYAYACTAWVIYKENMDYIRREVSWDE